MSRILRACIDRAALRANLAAVRRAAPGSRVMAVVKANAYGHGLVAVASTLAGGATAPGADAFAVARIEEGLEVLSGVRAGEAESFGTYPEGTLFRAVSDTLDLMYASLAAGPAAE